MSSDDARPTRRLGHSSVVRRVEATLRDALAYGRWQPGERLPGENALAKELGVGRSSLREALRLIGHDGLLEVRHGAGTYVVDGARAPDPGPSARIDHADTAQLLRRARIVEVYQVRRGLEVEAARLAAECAGPADLDALTEILARRQDLVGADTHEFVRTDLDFHRGIVALTGNTLLLGLFDQFREPLERAMTALVDQEPVPDTAAEHEALLAAIRAGDSAAAAAATAEHFDRIIGLFRRGASRPMADTEA